jgi:hypothetical protein
MDPGEDVISFVNGIAMLISNMRDHLVRMYRVTLKVVRFEESKAYRIFYFALE